MAEAQVGIKVLLEGVSEALQGMQSLLDTLGGFSTIAGGPGGGGGATNIFNPALSSAFQPTTDPSFQGNPVGGGGGGGVQAYPQPDLAAGWAAQSVQQQQTVGQSLSTGTGGVNVNPWTAPGAPGGYAPNYMNSGGTGAGRGDLTTLTIGRAESITIGSVTNLSIPGLTGGGGGAGGGGGFAYPLNGPVAPSVPQFAGGSYAGAAAASSGGFYGPAIDLFPGGGGVSQVGSPGFFGGGGAPSAAGAAASVIPVPHTGGSGGGSVPPGATVGGGAGGSGGGGGLFGGFGQSPLAVGGSILSQLPNVAMWSGINALTNPNKPGMAAAVGRAAPLLAAAFALSETADSFGQGHIGRQLSREQNSANLLGHLGFIPGVGVLAGYYQNLGSARDIASGLNALGGGGEAWTIHDFMKAGNGGQFLDNAEFAAQLAESGGGVIDKGAITSQLGHLNGRMGARRVQAGQLARANAFLLGASPYYATLLAAGSNPFDHGAGAYMGASAVMDGDLSLAGAAAGLTGDRGIIGRTLLTRGMMLQSQVAGSNTALAQTEFGRLQGTLRPYEQVLGQGATVSANLTEQVARENNVVAQLERTITQSGDPDGSLTLKLNQAKLQRDQSQSQLQSLPYQMAQLQFQGAMGRAGADVSQGQTAITAAQQRGDVHFTGGFQSMAGGLAGEIKSFDALIDQYRKMGAGDEYIRPLEAQRAGAQAQLDNLGITQRETTFQARMGFYGSGSQLLGAETSVARIRGDLSGASAGSRREAGFLGYQLREAEAHLAQVNADPNAGPGLRAAAAAGVAGLHAAIEQALAQAFQSAQQAILLPAQTGQVAGAAALGVAQGLGYTGGAMQSAIGADSAGVYGMQRASAQAYQNAVHQYGAGSIQAQQAQQALIQADAAARLQPVRALDAEFGSRSLTNALVMQGADADTSTLLASGAGASEVQAVKQTRYTNAQAEVRTQEERLSRFRALQAQGKVGENEVGKVEVALKRAQADEAQSRAGLGDLPVSIGVQERLAQTGYASQVLASMPGAYGSLRGALIGQMGGAEDAIHELQGALAHTDDPVARHRILTSMRQYGLQEMGAFSELSYGWENKLAGMMIGGRGNFNGELRGFALRNAVGAGIMNPHFGSNHASLGGLAYAGLAALPSAVPGQRYFGPGNDLLPGLGGFRGDADRGRGFVTPGAGAGDGGGATGGEFHIYIHTPDGRTTEISGSAGDLTSQGFHVAVGEHGPSIFNRNPNQP